MVDKRVSQKQKKNPGVKAPTLGYCLIKLKEHENQLSVFKELAGLEYVLEIDAIRGKVRFNRFDFRIRRDTINGILCQGISGEATIS